MFNVLAIAAAVAATVAQPAPAPVKEVRYCAENVPVEGTPYVRTVCKTRAQWIKEFHVDPINLDRR